MEKIVLHHCCAPCSPSVVEHFKDQYEIVSFWFNPNIHPDDEYEKRKNAFIEYIALAGIKTKLFGAEYGSAKWLDQAKGHEESRCHYCYELRIEETAEAARNLGIRKFSTTLLSSPYQDHELIRKLAEKAAASRNLEFVYHDFRPMFYPGKNKARELGLYSQKYCGCVFSKKEREIEREAKKKQRSLKENYVVK